MLPRHYPVLAAAVCILLLEGAGLCAKPAAGCATDCVAEAEPTLAAPALVQPALLSGPNFHVVPEVQLRGYMAHFLIDTPFGPLTADSVDLLAVRVAEIPALEALDRASRTGAFGHAIAERGRKTGVAVAHVAQHPIDTITGLPEGVVRYLHKQIDMWTGRAQSVADRSSREFENEGDPYHAPAGPMTAARDAPRDAADTGDSPKIAPAFSAYRPSMAIKNRAWYARSVSETQREAKRYLKYNEQRREMAKVLSVDPYSTNPILDDKLDTLAWAAVWGNFSAGSALGEITGGAADVISWSGKLNQYILQLDPEQLRERNRKRLINFCSDKFAVRQFLRRSGFTDTLRTALADSLERLKPQSGCNDLIELGATSRGEVEARYLVDALKLIESQPDTAGGEMLVAGAALAWRTPAGKLLLPLPVDYLTWNHAIDDFFDQPLFASRDKIALVGGEASMLAQRKLTERGWSVALHTPFDGAPAYALTREFKSARE
jgi:hypothetical protein